MAGLVLAMTREGLTRALNATVSVASKKEAPAAHRARPRGQKNGPFRGRGVLSETALYRDGLGG
jgi:hypothetical protein